MNKAELVKAISVDAKVSQAEVDAVLRSFVNVTTDAVMVKGDQVALPGLGTFKKVSKDARMGRNPQTGQAIQIPAKTVLVFKVSSTLKS